jgi:hypothetical protein
MSRIAVFVAALAFLSPQVIMEIWAVTHRREYRAGQDDPQEIKHRFRKRRTQAFLYSAAILAVGVTAMMRVKASDIGCIGIAIVLAAAIEVFSIVFRCPICYRIPMAWQYGRLRLVLNPTTCNRCGAPLGG